MRNHYIPRLLLKRFAQKEKVNVYDYETAAFGVQKFKNAFAMADIFDSELEWAFATKLEGPFANLLNHKLLSGDTVAIDRKENLLMRKFLMIQFLRAPIVNTTWDEMASAIAFWDCTGVEQEFILPKLPGISQMDQVSIFYKGMILRQLQEEKTGLTEAQKREVDRLIYGCVSYSENFTVYPLSPTRAMICFSPYFRAFFPSFDAAGVREVYPPLLQTEQFEKHFFKPMRMELFTPCKSIANQYYQYTVKQLQLEEVLELNALMLDMETEEFAFHDFTRIRDAFWYYDNKAQFALGKKHDFRQWE